MITQPEKYRGVVCVSCRQPVPLSSKAAERDAKFREQEPIDLVVPMFTLRCNTCDARRCMCRGMCLISRARQKCGEYENLDSPDSI
jgi:hypothetical protein